MNNSKLVMRLVALAAYCLASVCLLWRLLGLSFPVQQSPASSQQFPQLPQLVQNLPPHHPPARQLFRDQQPAESLPLYYPDVAKVMNNFDEETLKAAGFFAAQTPNLADRNDSQISDAYFDLARRNRLSQTDPFSIEAKIRRSNVQQLRFTFQGLAGKRSCRQGVDRILVTVMTTRFATERRHTIRQTWGSEADSTGARIVFFLAADENVTISRTLANEMSEFGDIVLVPQFLDTYRHLTLKVLSALQFACQLCPDVEMIAKVDDDSVLNLPSLRLLWLDRYSVRFPGLQYIAGYVYRAPVVRRFGRWLVSREDYPMARFPDYMFGGAYVLRVDACKLVAAAELFPLLPVEDAFITGVLPVALGLFLAPENSGFACQYFNHAGSLNAEAFMHGLVMSATDLTPRRMRGFWRRYQQLLQTNKTRMIRV